MQMWLVVILMIILLLFLLNTCWSVATLRNGRRCVINVKLKLSLHFSPRADLEDFNNNRKPPMYFSLQPVTGKTKKDEVTRRATTNFKNRLTICNHSIHMSPGTPVLKNQVFWLQFIVS